MSVVVVDWLGRGGIAQTAEVWVRSLRGLGVTAQLVSRANREVVVDRPGIVQRGPRAVQHAGLVATAARTILRVRPTIVVIHSWLVPLAELPVYVAARAVGAEVILVAHNHRSHTRSSGLDIGLDRAFAATDRIVCHSSFVANRIDQGGGRNLSVVPLPRPEVLLSSDTGPNGRDGLPPICLQFGVRRKTKDVELVSALAARRSDDWQFFVVGTMADDVSPNRLVNVQKGFQTPEALVQHVRKSDVVLLPYERASQSAAIVLARCLGSVPIASAVGGIPEQILHGEDGLLVPPKAGIEEWMGALDEAAVPSLRRSCAAQGEKRMKLEHTQFIEFVSSLVGSDLERPERLRIHREGSL